MRAAFIDQFGGPDKVQIGDQPIPQPGAGEVLIKTVAAGVGPWDVKMMGGMFGQLPLPLRLGLEAAGVVERAGDGVDLQPGDAVYGSVRGGFAEYVVASRDRLARKPDTLRFEEAAGLVIGGGTAYEGLIDRARLRSGESVLITAASGGVGSAAVQIAAAVGARVLAVAGARNHDYLRGLGARDVFDYHAADWVDHVRAAVPGGVDVLFDGAGGDTRDRAVGAVRDGGRAVFIVGPPSALERNISADVFAADVNRERLEALNRLVEEGKLRVAVEAVFPLDQAREALERVAGGHTRGKIVLTVG